MDLECNLEILDNHELLIYYIIYYLELVVIHEMEVLLTVTYLSYAIGLGKQPSMPLINLGTKTDIKMMMMIIR